MVNKPLIRPYFLGGVALGGVARIPMNLHLKNWCFGDDPFFWGKRPIFRGELLVLDSFREGTS